MAAILFRLQNSNLDFNLSLDQNDGDIPDGKSGLTIINKIPSIVWDEITYPSPNFNGTTVEVC